MFSKSIFKSVTFWGLVVTIAGPFLSKCGVANTDGLAEGIVEMIGSVTTLYGIARRQDIHVVGPILDTKPAIPPSP